MRNIIICCLFSAFYCLTSCSSGNKDEAATEKQNTIAHVDSLQKAMFDRKSMELDKNLAFKGIAAYKDFIQKYPDDSLSAEYLFRLSDLSRAVGDNGKAIEYLGQICKTYPNYKKIPECIFLQGYYYQQFFNDTNSAKQYYKQLLSKYPSHPFADDAQALMSMFGKTDEQMIQEFEKKEAEKKR